MPNMLSASRGALLVVLVAAVSPSAVAGQAPPDTLRLAELLATVRTANPMLAASRLRADAATARVAQAGALPDPQLTLGLMNRPLRGFGTAEEMTMNQVELSQVVPWPGKRGRARAQADFLASAERLAATDAEVTLLSRAKGLYYDLAAMDRTLTIMQRTRELLRGFFGVTQTRYAVGESPQQDVLRAQVAVAQMAEEITVMTQSRVATVARLNALLGRNAVTTVGALTLPPIAGAIAPVDSLMAIAGRQRPALQAAHARMRGASEAAASAKREGYPDLMFSIAYGQRPQYGDMTTLMVGFTLPLRPGTRQRPLQQEMAAMAAMVGAEADDLLYETYAELTEARAEAEQARELAALYQTAILPQARAGVDAALSAYRVGQVDYMTLVESEMTVNKYEIALVRLTAQYHQAVARIDALVGAPGVTP